jgi:hypothetical protein
VNALHRFPDLLNCFKQVMNVHSADYQGALLGFDLPSHFGMQPSVTGIYLARFQRAPEGSDHSTAQSGHNVIESCRMRFGEFCWIETIMLGNGSMDTERHALRLPGQLSPSKGPDRRSI